MKKLLIIALLGLSTQAMAGGCAPLDYEEMKDMDTKELTQTYCKYHNDWQDKLKFAIAYEGSDSDFAEVHGCQAQVERMSRILKKREGGVQSIIDTCPMAY